MRIAVVGASGFVGRHLIRHLTNQGIRTVPLAREMVASPALKSAIEGCDALVNCAGNKTGVGAPAREANVALPLRLIHAAIDTAIPATVQVSSVAALSSTTAPGLLMTDTDPARPTSAYGLSKREGDDAMLQAARARGYNALAILRPPILIGHDAGGVFALLRSMARAGVPLPLRGVSNSRSFMHVDNFAAAVLAAVEARCRGTFIVTDSPPLSSAELYARMLAAAGHDGRLFSVGATGRMLLRKLLGHRGESLFGNAAFAGDRFAAEVKIDWPVPPAAIIERTMATH